MTEFAPGELVRVSPEGNYGDPLWAGALAIVVRGTREGHWVLLRRLADGTQGEIRAPRVEKPND